MEIFKKGDRVIHPRFGLGTVEEGDAEGKVTIDFDQMGRKQLMLQYAQLRFATPSEEDAAKPGGKTYEKWLKTFVFEDKETKHSLGSHWEPFYDDSTFIIKRLSDILPKALMQVAFADSRPALRSVPTDWPKAAYLTWPLRIHGLSLVIRVTPGNPNEIVSLFPFCTEGCQQRIIIDKVYVWRSGVEAQVEAILGEVCITFFDILYARNRDWYEAGVSYQFILTGIAYTCRKAEDQIVEITNPEVVEAIRKSQIESGDGISYKDRIPIHTKGMASLLPINEWDRDDYQFHGPVKSVKDIEVLGQIGWRVRTTVLRQLNDDNEFDLDIIVTKKVWGNKSPPQIGDDIVGTLWLQGYLWYPDSIIPSNEDEKGLRGLVSSNSYNGYKEDMKYTCPCCGYKTLSESGNYDLCPICYWEDDPSQYEDPDLEGGPNSPSLRQAQLNFIRYGACDQECLSYVRSPGMWDVRDPAWLPLHQIQENILTLQKEFEKNCDLPVTLFKSVSFLFFKEKLDRCRNEKKDERRRNKKYQEEYSNAKSDALGKIKDEQIRHWLIKAESVSDVEFMVKAKASFWKWLEKVKACSHLHLELITDSGGFAPLYNCRYCGAYVGCTCFFKNPNSWPVNQYISVRPSAISDFIPYRVFKEVFIRPNVCYRCRKDEDMAAPRAYGKNKIEKVYWRELFAEEGKAWAFLRGKEFQTGDEIITLLC